MWFYSVLQYVLFLKKTLTFYPALQKTVAHIQTFSFYFFRSSVLHLLASRNPLHSWKEEAVPRHDCFYRGINEGFEFVAFVNVGEVMGKKTFSLSLHTICFCQIQRCPCL